MRKVIIFDFDGTIANTTELAYQVYERLFERHKGIKLSLEEIEILKALPFRERLKKQKIPIFRVPSLIRKTRIILGEIIDLANPYKQMKEMLFLLKENNYDLYIVSSNSISNIEIFLKNHQMEVFTYIQGGSSYFGKARKIKKLLKKIKVEVKDAIYIGDEARDIMSCKAIGLDVIGVTYGFDDEKLLSAAEPTHLVRDVNQLQKLLMHQ